MHLSKRLNAWRLCFEKVIGELNCFDGLTNISILLRMDVINLSVLWLDSEKFYSSKKPKNPQLSLDISCLNLIIFIVNKCGVWANRWKIDFHKLSGLKTVRGELGNSHRDILAHDKFINRWIIFCIRWRSYQFVTALGGCVSSFLKKCFSFDTDLYQKR